MKDFAISITRALHQRGFQAYLVGGCVRDVLLKREPADYDVATSATPAQIMEIFPDTYAVGVQFGVVLVPLPESQRPSADADAPPKSQAVEVATFRCDLRQALSARSAIRSGGLRKISCGCCGQCALRRALSMKSKRGRWPLSNAWPTKFMWYRASGFAMKLQKC